MQIVVTVTGLDVAVEKNEALAAQLQDFTEGMLGIGTTLVAYYGEAPFITEGEIFGYKWTALKQKTLDEKTRHSKNRALGVGASQMLVDSGNLRRGFRAEATPRSVYIDNEVPYWKYHQTGTGLRGFGGKGVGRGKNLPQRKTIDVDDVVKQMVQAIIQTEVESKIKVTMS